jgi:hypothetical protein
MHNVYFGDRKTTFQRVGKKTNLLWGILGITLMVWLLLGIIILIENQVVASSGFNPVHCDRDMTHCRTLTIK